jgi:uncharacterized membrane protein (UPF0127 family)
MGSYCFHNVSSNKVVGRQIRAADSYLKRLAGLLFCAPLKQDEGLWLHPCNAIHTLFMRFAIDVIFLDRNGTVVRVFPKLIPFMPLAWAPSGWHCLELSSGTIAASNTKVGDKLSWAKND